MWRTHALCGISSLWLLELVPHGIAPASAGLMAATAVVGALLPDLDAADSKAKHLSVFGVKPLLPVAGGLHRAYGHRGALHSLRGLAAFATVTLPLSIWCGWQVWVALGLGYGSHLAADACTRSGISVQWPDRRRFYILPPSLRVTTGSRAEDLFFVIAAFAALFLMLRHLPYH
jgi:inner membrane protein